MSITDRPLKTKSTEELEKSVAEAIGRLIGQDYKATIAEINFEPDSNAYMSDSAVMTIKLRNTRYDLKPGK